MRSAAPTRKARHIEPVILFGVGTVTFAISANDVDEIRDMSGLAPAGITAPSAKVRFRLVREGKTYWVIDASEHFRMPASKVSRVLVLRNTNTAVLVERIDKMAEISNVVQLPKAFSGAERSWYSGLAILTDGANPRAVPVVNSVSLGQATKSPEVLAGR